MRVERRVRWGWCGVWEMRSRKREESEVPPGFPTWVMWHRR